MVTFELAVGLLTATMVTIMLGWCIHLVTLQARCQATAYAVARQIARGDATEAEHVLSLGPRGARMGSVTGESQVRVEVSVDSSLGIFGPVEVRAEATVPVEP